MFEVGGRTQHAVRTVADAELAGGAMVVEMLYAHGAEGNKAFAAFGALLVDYIGEAAVKTLYHLGRCVQGGSGKRAGSDHRRAGRDKTAPAAVSRSLVAFLSCRGLSRQRRLESDEAVSYRTFGAVVDAVEAQHAAAAVDIVPVHVDARGLATASAALAGHAFAFVYRETEQ